ncbi:MAG: hypothetical protein RLZZ366_1801 [Pseudomonadota bacterium]
MTLHAVGGDAAVVHYSARKAGEVFMAELARLCGGQVGRCFGQTLATRNMARDTVGGDAAVVHDSAGEGRE